ncbi:Mrp/NBP35 family ATP-binding protein [Methanotrichaceae archaeon M04Ac]|uniref:Iron-sulfur cluster carrier protein n=1 Tax=Candidatus Methanocrinis alkalitolerans TaxID=3033395 RepID=A0ABT5XF13_9EURY|nr:Mrp/NBP35 family ATP-binding protein [Candidatus Methanocrinis alkalitolerans]MCR3883593.1 Mrp/NBP35 family ATP-binding protein [Methanothrix sp.]MDF0593303.1 Mrp/NBP35 family ATP-binding protein [Candidatus Methanocrinis alkalitolerans]
MMTEPEENRIKHSIMVMSGKGGVGKTTVAVNLGLGLALRGKKVGILDADITGPNVPKMLKIEDEVLTGEDDRTIRPVEIPVGADGELRVISMAFIIGKESPVVWRGPLKTQMLKQFIEKVAWGDLDYMLIDLPPGTGDEPLSIAQLLRPDGTVVVTTPQDLALLDARRAIDMSRSLGVPVLGIVENMSGFSCPRCGGAIDLFKVGGGERAAEELQVPFLGKIEIDPAICESGDSGRPFILSVQSKNSEPFDGMARRIMVHYESGDRDSWPKDRLS